MADLPLSSSVAGSRPVTRHRLAPWRIGCWAIALVVAAPLIGALLLALGREDQVRLVRGIALIGAAVAVVILTSEGADTKAPPSVGSTGTPTGPGTTGLGKPLKLINHPVRSDIPIAVAALGGQSVEMTAELADAWLPAFYTAEAASAVKNVTMSSSHERVKAIRPPAAIAGRR